MAVRVSGHSGADFNHPMDEEGTTPLGYAASVGDAEIARLLTAAGADVNHGGVDIQGTPLHQVQTLRMMLCGADQINPLP